MNWSESLPCPFCGNTELIVSETAVPVNSTRFPEMVVCGQCGTCGPWADSEDAAILIWNTKFKEAP